METNFQLTGYYRKTKKKNFNSVFVIAHSAIEFLPSVVKSIVELRSVRRSRRPPVEIISKIGSTTPNIGRIRLARSEYEIEN